MNASRRTGFTLIELLTVVAIIAILAGMVFTVGPRMIERAKLRRLDGALRQVSIQLVAYSTDNKKATYPAAYGYVEFSQVGNPPPADPSLDETFYQLRPYTLAIKEHGNIKLYDEFSESYDTDRDGTLSLLEFGPAGYLTPLKTWVFDSGLPRYTPNTAGLLTTEIGRQLDAKQRPFIYIPVNRTQATRTAKYWIKNNDFLATQWDPASPDLQGVVFPPAKYDAFALISVGPAGSTFGLVKDVPSLLANVPERDWYHVAALRSYFLATRDLNANSLLDFDYNARTREGEAKAEYQVNGRDCNNQLPCDTPNNAGPYIYVSQ